MRQLQLWKARQVEAPAIWTEDAGGVEIASEAAVWQRNVVRNHEVYPLAEQLVARMLDQLLGLGRKPHQERPRCLAARGSHLGQDIRRGSQLKREGLPLLLDFALRAAGRLIVSHGSRHDQNVSLAASFSHAVAHLLGPLDGRNF